MAKKRSIKKWNNTFLINQKTFESISSLSERGDDNLVKEACVAYRNPVVFDNQVSATVFELPYYIPENPGDINLTLKLINRKIKDKKMVKDHLIGMSNIVLYIHKNKINERWQNADDFMTTLKALQVLLPIPKWLNNKATYKSWQFDIQNIDNCIKWNEKLKREGITHLNCLDGTISHVDDVWNSWYDHFKKYL
jgi:hypothetical protein